MSDEHGAHSEKHYVQIYLLLLVMLAISIAGPELEIQIVTLITAFGIAFYKAWLVIKHFMHIPAQPRYVTYLLTTSLVFMLLFFAGTAPDVMKWEGAGWHKPFIETAPVAGETDSGGHH